MLRVCRSQSAAIVANTEVVEICGIAMHLITENTPLWTCTKMSDSPFPMPYWGFCWPGSYALTKYIQDNPAIVANKKVLDFAAGCSIAGIAASQCGASSVVCNDIDEWSCIASQMNADINSIHAPLQMEAANMIGNVNHRFGSDQHGNEDGSGGGEPWVPHSTREAPELEFLPMPTSLIETLDEVDVVLAGDVCYDDVLAAQVPHKFRHATLFVKATRTAQS